MDDTIQKLWNYVKDSYYNYKSNPTVFRLSKILFHIIVLVIGSIFILNGQLWLKLFSALTNKQKTQSGEYRERPIVVNVVGESRPRRSQFDELFGDTSGVPRMQKPQVGVPREFRPPKPYFPRTPDPFEGQPRRSKRRKGGGW